MLRVLIGIHIAAGLTAVVAGAGAMLAPKRPGPHPRRGRVYLCALAAVALTAAGIAAARPHTAYLLLLGAAALAAAGTGYAARRIRWPGWLHHHLTGMALSYIAMLTAFYVDNGPRLPVWNLLPPIAFWFLPAAVGLLLLIRARRRHPQTPAASEPTPNPGAHPRPPARLRADQGHHPGAGIDMAVADRREESNVMELVKREFIVDVAAQDAWAWLAVVEQWPSWAHHIKRVSLTPPGSLTSSSTGRFHLAGGLRSTFRMERFEPPVRWLWVGRVLTVHVHYDHRFEPVDQERTRLTWLVSAHGLGAATLGRLFGALYARNLDRAIPRLQSQLGSELGRPDT
jgi:hypothetical protein